MLLLKCNASSWRSPVDLFRHELELGLVDEIQRATNGNFALGNGRFAAQVSLAPGKRVVPGKTERPCRASEQEQESGKLARTP